MGEQVQAVFLDRDGTIIEERHYLGTPAGVSLLPGSREALAAAVRMGVQLFLFTNQSGVNRGFFSLTDVRSVNEKLFAELGLGENLFERICVATERPDEPQVYRKPSPRFINEMIEEFGFSRERVWMLGDKPSDWEAGWNAGVLVGSVGRSRAEVVAAAGTRFCKGERGLRVFSDLLDWARFIRLV